MLRVSSFALTKRLLVLIVLSSDDPWDGIGVGADPRAARAAVARGGGRILAVLQHPRHRHQNYICLPVGAAFAWRPIGPQATLFQTFFGFRQQVGTHFLSANPDEGGVARATWQHSLDTSRVWARLIETSSDPCSSNRMRFSG